MHFAAMRGGIPVLENLKKHGANIDELDSACRTPLHYAACRANAPVVDWLIEMGADPVAADLDGRIPLHGAAMTTDLHEGIMIRLVQSGCSLYVYDAFHMRPIDLALIYGTHYKLLEHLNSFAQPPTKELACIPPPRPLYSHESEFLAVLVATLDQDRDSVFIRAVRRLGVEICNQVLIELLTLLNAGLTPPGSNVRMAKGCTGFTCMLRQFWRRNLISKSDLEYITQMSKERSCALKKRKKKMKQSNNTMFQDSIRSFQTSGGYSANSMQMSWNNAAVPEGAKVLVPPSLLAANTNSTPARLSPPNTNQAEDGKGAVCLEDFTSTPTKGQVTEIDGHTTSSTGQTGEVKPGRLRVFKFNPQADIFVPRNNALMSKDNICMDASMNEESLATLPTCVTPTPTTDEVPNSSNNVAIEEELVDSSQVVAIGDSEKLHAMYPTY
eukprot:Platyproteum_vivax@DN5206_c0_g1_i1.p1